ICERLEFSDLRGKAENAPALQFPSRKNLNPCRGKPYIVQMGPILGTEALTSSGINIKPKNPFSSLRCEGTPGLCPSEWTSQRIRFSKLTFCCICWRSSVSRFAYLRLISSEE